MSGAFVRATATVASRTAPATANGMILTVPIISPATTGFTYPGQTGSLTVSVDRGKLAGAPQLGWLIATLDDPNGAAQADEIPIG